MNKSKLIEDIDNAVVSDKVDENTKRLLLHFRNELCNTTNKKKYIEIFLNLIRLLGIGYDIISSLD